MGYLRDRICDEANMAIGGYISDEKGPTRAEMNDYFAQAWGYSYDQAGAHTKSHWCGIWAVYILIQAGLTARWGPVPKGWGVVSPQVKVHNGNKGIQPGDVGYVTAGDHHFLITRVDQELDFTECIDGNAGGVGNGYGTIRRRWSRKLSEIACYYEILE